MRFFEKNDQGYLLRVRLTPNSSSVKILGFFKDSNDFEYLKISVVSVPEKGKANQELIEFLSRYFKISKSAFEIVSGQTDRYKKIQMMTMENMDSILENMAL